MVACPWGWVLMYPCLLEHETNHANTGTHLHILIGHCYNTHGAAPESTKRISCNPLMQTHSTSLSGVGFGQEERHGSACTEHLSLFVYISFFSPTRASLYMNKDEKKKAVLSYPRQPQNTHSQSTFTNKQKKRTRLRG